MSGMWAATAVGGRGHVNGAPLDPYADVPPPEHEPDTYTDGHHPTMRERLLSVFDLANLPTVAPLVKGLLYRGTLAQLAGAPGSYKSFVSLAWALSLALGRDFGTHHVPSPGRVVYVAAEGATGMQARILAFCEYNDIDPADTLDRLYVLPAPIQLGNRVDISDALVTVDELGASLLVLDTRARCTVGLDENSATDQGRAIAAVDRIVESGCTVLGVHHAGRSGGPRGSNSWDGAVWSDLRISGGGFAAAVQCEKHKDVISGCNHRFRLVPYTVSAEAMPRRPGQSADDWLTSRSTLVAAPAVDHEVDHGKRGPDGNSGRIVRDIVRRCAPPDGLTRPNLVVMAKDEKLSRSQAYEAINRLVTQGVLANVAPSGRERFVLAPGLSKDI